jgi:hypothetical protein
MSVMAVMETETRALDVALQSPVSDSSPLAEIIAQHDAARDVVEWKLSRARDAERNGFLQKCPIELSGDELSTLSPDERSELILDGNLLRGFFHSVPQDLGATSEEKAQDVPQDLGAPDVPQELKNSRTKETKNTLGAHEAQDVPQDLGATSKEKSPENLIPAEKGFSVSGSRGTQKTGVMHDMLAAYERGEIEPEPVEMTLPKHLGKYARAVANDMALLFGLKRARCDEFPLPYAQSFGAERLSISRDDVKRARAQLVRAGVIEEAGALPILDRRRRSQWGNPTKLYRLPDMESTSA